MEEIHAWWTLLNVPPALVDTLVAYDLVWDGEVLYAHISVMRERNVVDTIQGLLLFMFRWRSFSKTRWAGVGPSSRMFTLSLAGGADCVWNLAMRDPHVPKELLGGYTYIGEDEKLTIGVAVFSTFAAEQFILDRLGTECA